MFDRNTALEAFRQRRAAFDKKTRDEFGASGRASNEVITPENEGQIAWDKIHEAVEIRKQITELSRRYKVLSDSMPLPSLDRTALDEELYLASLDGSIEGQDVPQY